MGKLTSPEILSVCRRVEAKSAYTAHRVLQLFGKVFRRDAIERQLAHGERNKVRAAYNHAEHLPERRRMMQKWADYLDKLRGQK